MYNREQIDNVHPDYAANIANWRLYSDSYNGGAQYRNGEYLMKYQLETATVKLDLFNKRARVLLVITDL